MNDISSNDFVSLSFFKTNASKRSSLVDFEYYHYDFSPVRRVNF